MGTPSLTGTTTASITIEDVNDNAPVFDSASYSFVTVENVNIGTTLGTVTATDDDYGTNGQFTVSKSKTLTLNTNWLAQTRVFVKGHIF